MSDNFFTKKEHKGIKKWHKISIVVVALLLLLGLGSYYLLITKPVQTLIGRRILAELSERTGTQMSASQVSFSKFRQLDIKDLYIEDQNRDTLLYAPEASAKLDSLNRTTRYISLASLRLKQAQFKIKQDDDSLFNFAFLVDSLYDRNKPDSLRWKVDFQQVVLADADVALSLKGQELRRFNPLSLSAQISPEQIELQQLTFRLNNGLYLQKSEASIQLTPSAIRLPYLNIITANSHLTLRDIMLATDSGEWKSRPWDDRFLSLQSYNSRLSGKDLSLFLADAYAFDQDLIIDGRIDGKPGQLQGDDIHLKVADALDVYLAVELKHPFVLDSLHYTLSFNDLTVDIENAAKIYNALRDTNALDVSAYEHWDSVAYEGLIAGTRSELNAKGQLKTRYGQVNTDLDFAYEDSLQHFAYKGSLSSTAFRIGEALLMPETMGKTSGRFYVHGDRQADGDLDSYFNAQISQLELLDYAYHNISLNGGVGPRYFDGKLKINDPNAQLDFRGEVDLFSEEPRFNFTLDLGRLAMKELKLVDSYEHLNLSLQMQSFLSGNHVDDLNGFLKVDSLDVLTEYGEFLTDSIYFSFKPLDEMPSISMSSEYINGLILGSYNFSEMLGYINTSLKKHMKHLPQSFTPPKSEVQNDFTFAFEVSNMEALATVLDLPLRSNGFSVVSGVMDAPNDRFELDGELPYLLTKTELLDTVTIRMNNTPEQLSLDVLVDRFTFGGDHVMDDIAVNMLMANDTIDFSTRWDNEGEEKYRGDFKSNIWLQPYGRDLETVLEIQPSEFVFADTLWQLNHHFITIRQKHMTIDSLMFSHEHSYFTLDGVASESLTDTMSFRVNDFDLSNLNRFLSVNNFTFDGVMSGQAELLRVLKDPILTSDLQVDNVFVNESSWGDLTAISEWKGDNKELQVYVDFTSPQDGETLVNAYGSYYPANDSLDIDADFSGFDVTFLQPYLKRTMTQLQGKALGHLDVRGPIADPELYGALKVEGGAFHIDYLSTDFYFNDSIHFDKNRFVFDETVIEDQEGNYGFVTGSVQHSAYKNMLVNLVVESDRLLALNTESTENEYFFGDIYFGGAVTIRTTATKTLIGSNARTMYGSYLTVPLSPVSTANTNNFIIYKTIEEEVQEESSRLVLNEVSHPKKHLVVDMNFDVTPDALVRLEFDDQSGEVIEAAGVGNLNIQFERGQPFQMFGEYEIERGDYLFTIQQVFNKRFDIVSGSVLQWSGNPADAVMDITAQYQTRASLYNLMPDVISESSKNRRVPVNVMLYLTQSLRQPDIAFDISLPNTDEETQQSVSSIINTEEEMSRQVLSLLIMNSFYTPDYYTDASTLETNDQFASVAAVTVSEFMSNQLSNWMSQISDNFNLGVRWTPEQELEGEGLSPDEYEVIISTQLFNDRLTVNGNVGYQDYAAEARPPNVNSNFVGEVDVELKISESVKLKAYSHQNDDILYENTNMKQGAGVAYEKDFVSLRDWLFKHSDREKAEAVIKEEEDEILEEPDEEDDLDRAVSGAVDSSAISAENVSAP